MLSINWVGYQLQQHRICEPAQFVRPALMVKHQNHGLRARGLERPNVRSRVRPEVPGPKLSLDCNRCRPAEVGAVALRLPTSVCQFIGIGCTQVQSVAVTRSDRNGAFASTTHY